MFKSNRYIFKIFEHHWADSTLLEGILKRNHANFQNDLDKVTHKKALIFKIGQIAPFLGF